MESANPAQLEVEYGPVALGPMASVGQRTLALVLLMAGRGGYAAAARQAAGTL